MGPGRETGEIVVSGDCLALGYLDDDSLTAERFVSTPAGRAYRTGDQGWLTPDGVLEFAGRRDSVVKVRGVRVDLAAVESALRRLTGVQAAAAVAVDDGAGPTEVVAFVVGDGLAASTVRARMSERVPTAMVPTRIEIMPDLPVTDRGKVDRRALEARATRRIRPPYVVPADVTESTIVADIAATTSAEAVGRDDDIFDRPTSSSSRGWPAARLTDALGVRIDSADLIENPTAARLAAFVRAGAKPRQPGDSHLTVVSRGSRDRMPVVLFPGGGGGHVKGMVQLARALDGRACYVAMTRAFEYRGRPDRTIAAMAASAAADIRDALGGGPVILVGHSSGGTVALEVARQVSGCGVEVPLVILLDTLAVTEEVVRRRRFWPELGFRLRDGQRRRAARGEGTSIARKAYWVVRYPVRRARRRWLAATAGWVERTEADQHAAFEALVKVAARKWQEAPYPGAVHLIRAEDSAGDDRTAVEDLRWTDVPGVRVTISRVAATHNGMTSGADAVVTAREVERQLAGLLGGEEAAQ